MMNILYILLILSYVLSIFGMRFLGNVFKTAFDKVKKNMEEMDCSNYYEAQEYCNLANSLSEFLKDSKRKMQFKFLIPYYGLYFAVSF